jgi:hypothetical protein
MEGDTHALGYSHNVKNMCTPFQDILLTPTTIEFRIYIM